MGNDPELADPDGGDYRALRATGYGCRVFGDGPAARPAAAATATRPPVARPGRLDVGGVIDQDTVWDAADIVMRSDVTVTGGATLTIAAGATVTVDGFHRLLVEDGDLQAVGTGPDRIRFTSAEPAAWRPDLERAGAWNGLAFANVPAANDSSRLHWCVIEYAKALPGDAWIVPDSTQARPAGVLVGGVGGAVRVAGASPLSISHCVLRHNVAERGGAIGVHHGARPLLVNNLLHENHAALRGGAAYLSCADAVWIHDTVAANDVAAPHGSVETGAIDHVFARPWYTGCVVWGNTSSWYTDLQMREPKACNVVYSAVQDWLGGEGCLTDDPLLDDLLVPAEESPVVDAASAAAAGPWLPALDLAAGARVVGDGPDMGAFEARSPTGQDAVGDVAAAAPSLGCWPNPFNPRTAVTVTMPVAGRARVDVCDLRGRRVDTLLDGELTAGPHRVAWAPRLPSGAYLLVLRTADGRTALPVALVR